MRKYLGKIYKTRYDRRQEEQKSAIWQVLCSDFLQRFIAKNNTVLDIAAGHCEFINNILCRQKYALDIDKRTSKYAHQDVQVIIGSALSLPRFLYCKIDVIFMGCFLEHLPNKQAIIKVLIEIKKVLKKDGKLIILNPNIRFSTADYWDYFDHLIPVSDRSIVEILTALGYQIDVCLPKFVPNTVRDKLPKNPFLVKLYLHLPFLFPIFGKQMFIVAHPI